MNTDHDFQIGSEHQICEDYALSGMGEGGESAYGIVSDGCSASLDVDIGARLQAVSARETLKNVENLRLEGNFYQSFGNETIQRIGGVMPMFPSLGLHVLDATLLVVWVKNGWSRCLMYGDGIYFKKDKDGYTVVHLEYKPKPAPSYLSYELTPELKEKYLAQNITKERVTLVCDKNGVETSRIVNTLPSFEPILIETQVASGDVVGVGSDGVNSFKKSGDIEIPWEETIKEYIGYKNFEGTFVKRRMGAFRRKCVKEGTTHYDDISIASIVV